MARLLVDDKDIKFVLFDLLKIQDVLESKRFSDWNEKALGVLLGEALKFAEKILFPLNIEGDKTGARFESGQVYTVPGMKDAYSDFADAGWLTPCENEDLGGQELPEVIKVACHEMFLAANFPFMCLANLTHDAAKLIELFGTDDQKNRYMRKMYDGEWTGTMALSEPGAGSDVGAVETRATQAEDGSYRIAGQKIFITNGEHDVSDNIVHMILARIEGHPPGTKGLSIFIVPKYRLGDDGSIGEANDVKCIGIEHKMGLHASPTTAMSFGENGDCHGYLLGKEREGIKIMFHMMNASRLAVGVWGQATCSASYLHALNYAKGRKQGPSLRNPSSGSQGPIIDHPDIRRMLTLMKSLVEGMRIMLYYSGYAMDRAETATSEEERADWLNLVDILIPICKAYPTEKGVELASQAIQIYGGYGYTKDYPVEQFMRDVKVACIFEGTTGIQGMDFSLRKARMKGGQVFRKLLDQIDDMVQEAEKCPDLERYAAQVRKTAASLGDIPSTFARGSEETGLLNTLLNSTPFLDAAGDVMVAYFLLWSAVAAEGKLNDIFEKKDLSDGEKRKDYIRKNAQASFLAGKVQSAKYFIANMLPVTDGKLAAIAWGDLSAWEIEDKSF